MIIDGVGFHIKQPAHEILRQPDSLVFTADFNAFLATLLGEYQKFGGAE